eukprot:TRINITY_DN29326_c0_g1_i1.p1 TRINITY_DN29326_c0_g1~~TRINITY_DN29326_c0_g1_i1.p1  ORF type:complete len:448 (+),score=68.88 TRINITY_DN29326_c0_g1_i1:222-1565(+)
MSSHRLAADFHALIESRAGSSSRYNHATSICSNDSTPAFFRVALIGHRDELVNRLAAALGRELGWQHVPLQDNPGGSPTDALGVAHAWLAGGGHAIVSCTLSIANSTPGTRLLQGHWPVIHVCEPETDSWESLSGVASHVIQMQEHDWENSLAGAVRLVRTLTTKPEPPLGAGTYYASLTSPELTDAMKTGAEWKPPPNVSSQPLHSAMEIRVDLLASQDPLYVLTQISVVRQFSQGRPLIYTVRTKGQGGDFEDDEAKYFELMILGLKFGCEYVDLECCWSRENRNAYLHLIKEEYPNTRVIASYHAVQQPLSMCSDFEIESLFHECASAPEGLVVDIVKVVAAASDVQCSIRMHQIALKAQQALPEYVASIVAICTQAPGRLSRALNVMLGPTPVAHPVLEAAAPGQLSAIEIEQIRSTLGLESNPFSEKASSPLALGRKPSFSQ